MARKSTTARLHLLTAREVHKAGVGDHADGGNLLLRVRGESASWVFRYTAPSGKRRDMGMGIAHRGSLPQAGDSLTGARDAAHKARELLRQGLDPLAERDTRRQAAAAAEVERKIEKTKEQLTLARAARGYHQRVIEPTRTPKHSAQWISTLENHVPSELCQAPISSITAPALLKALEGITPHRRARNLTSAGGKLPETVRRIRQRLESIFEDAQFHGHVVGNPAAAIRRKMREAQPGKKAKKAKNERGFKALPYKDAPAFMGRLRTMPGTAARCLEYAVLTAARTSEALLGGGTMNMNDLPIKETLHANMVGPPMPPLMAAPRADAEAPARQCAECRHYGRSSTCLEPVAAGLLTQTEGFGIVWPPDGHGVDCSAFAPLTLAATTDRLYRLLRGQGSAAHAVAWDNTVIARFQARVGPLRRQGLTTQDADDLAELLHLRDVQADQRALCVECDHFRPGRCGNHRAAGLQGSDVSRDLATLLQRCPGFATSPANAFSYATPASEHACDPPPGPRGLRLVVKALPTT